MKDRKQDPLDTDLVDLGDRRTVRPQRLSFSPYGMASTAHYRATEAATEVLAAGGNAVDGAVAAAFALGVCEPQASGLGGQSVLLVHLVDPRRTFILDGSSRAPNHATPGSLDRADRRFGYKATTVPSTPATLGYALEKYGTRTLADVLAPSIRLAKSGVEVSELFRALSRREAKSLRKGNAAPLFLTSSGRAHAVGAKLVQPALAKTFEGLARRGIEDFYTGRIARRIHADMQANGGLLDKDDLAQVPWPIERKPLSTKFHGMRVVTCPPPGAGRVLVEMLHLVEQFDEKLWDADQPGGALLLAEIMRQGARDRLDRPFDAEFYAQVDEHRMTDRGYAVEVAKKIRRILRKRPDPGPPPPATTGETTHLTVMDRDGNVVALTQSIERVFGAKVATPDLGFLYNNYMSAFEYEDSSHPYAMRPNAVPWASVAPTIVFRGRRPWVALGSPGSERIVTSVLQVLLRLITHSPFEAVDAPRLHCNTAGRVSLETARFRDDIPRVLAQYGFEIDERDPYSFYLGCVQLVMRDRYGFIGVADPRRDGSASGPLS